MEEQWLVGIDIGGTTIKTAFFTEKGDIVHKWEMPTNKVNNGDRIIPEIVVSIQKKLDELNISAGKLKGAGIGAPGPVDTEKGLLFEAINLGWRDHYPLRDYMQAALHLPVAIDNDANCAALGEMWKGAGAGSKDLVCITIGTGVGGGIIINGDIIHGKKGAAGEVGHMTSVPSGGYLCNCGKKGCLETIASATGLVRLALEKIEDDKGNSALKKYEQSGLLTAKHIFDAARSGDKIALETIDTLAESLGIALADIGNVLNPEKVIIGGGVSQAGSLLLSPVEQYFKKYAFKPVAASTKIVLSELGNDAGVTGAAWLANYKI